ncbi:MAG: hypothetical protein H7239_14000 [Flavobacterium sp.]|nr:hypothetical protein [Flavobacterium sp.]
MTHPISIQEFKEKLKNLISNSSKITNPKVKDSLIRKLNFISNNHFSKPGKPNFDKIKADTEVAFQRAIYNGITTQLQNESEIVKWIDIEVPVVLSENRRRPCIDIIGSNKDKLVLCELKFKKKSNPSDTPYYAVFELLIYYYFVRCNYENLDEFNVFHDLATTKNFKWEKYLKNSTPQLIVTANDSYWEYYLKRKDYKMELSKAIEELENVLNIKVQLFKTKNENFDIQKQKGENETYCPKVTSNIWTEI